MRIGNEDWERGLGMGTRNEDWGWGLGMGNRNEDWEWGLGMRWGSRSVVRIGKTTAKTMYITIPCIAATIVEGQLYKEALCSRYFYLSCKQGQLTWLPFAHKLVHLPVTPAKLMKPGIGQNVSCAVGDFARPVWWFVYTTTRFYRFIVCLKRDTHPLPWNSSS